MFSQACVKNSVHRGSMHGGEGACVAGVCVAEGCMAGGVIHGRGHVWWGGFGLHGRGPETCSNLFT